MSQVLKGVLLSASTAASASFEVGDDGPLVLSGPSIPELVSMSRVLRGVLPSAGGGILRDPY
jgi:hypothetical protein